MANIQSYTRWLQIISVIFAVFLFGEIFVRWFFGSFFGLSSGPVYDLYLRGCYSFDCTWFRELSHMSFIQKILGFIVDAIGLGILSGGIIAFNQLLKYLRTGIFFTTDIVHSLGTLSKFALGWALYTPLKTTLLSIITTLHKGPGNRLISFEFGIKDMINIFIFVCVIIITAFMQEGLKLKKEQDLTI